MIKPIVKDVFFLGHAKASVGKVRWTFPEVKSEPATAIKTSTGRFSCMLRQKQDLSVGQDLMDTLRANQDHCVGMAANIREAMRKVLVMLA